MPWTELEHCVWPVICKFENLNLAYGWLCLSSNHQHVELHLAWLDGRRDLWQSRTSQRSQLIELIWKSACYHLIFQAIGFFPPFTETSWAHSRLSQRSSCSACRLEIGTSIWKLLSRISQMNETRSIGPLSDCEYQICLSQEASDGRAPRAPWLCPLATSI